jgi:Tfp pilus assembly protein PilN
MRAVNLLPAELRPGGAGAGRSGGAVYGVLAVLGVLVIALAAYVLTANSVTRHRADLARASQEAALAQREAAALKPYRDFAALSRSRVQTVASLAASRFDWERTLRELSRVLPDDVWLTSLTATVAPGVTFDGASSSSNTGSLRGAVQAPALELLGCTTSQADVSRVMARLRLMHGVQRVALSASEKADTAGAGGAGATSTAGGSSASGTAGASGSDCRNGSSRFPQFQLVVFFRPLPGAAGQGAGGSGSPAPVSTTPPTPASARSVSTPGQGQ